MPWPRFERATPEIRVALLEAAADEFTQRGYEGASVNRILAAAGLSKGAFYYYFDDKADLAATVLAGETRAWLETIRGLPRPATPEEFWEGMERLNERAMAQLREAPRQSDLLTRLGRSSLGDAELMARLAPFHQEARGILADFYRRGQQIGAIRSDLSAETLLAIFQGTKQALTLALLPADRAPSPAEMDEFGRVNLDCLRRLAEPARSPAKPRAPASAPRSAGRSSSKTPVSTGRRASKTPGPAPSRRRR
jgi:AcrR family transcriptional regulator